MKALTLWQPYASLIAEGFKAIETRGWSTPYRGPLAIHAARHWSEGLRARASEINGYLIDRGRRPLATMPLGRVVCVVDLVGVRQVKDHWDKFPESERVWGDLSPGRFAWMLENPRRLLEPVSATGRQGLWTVGPNLLSELERRLEEVGSHAS
jgi:hypothetical protein